MSTWTEWEDPRRVLARHGLTPKRALSQNFLISPHAVERIADAVAPADGEQVLELGPGAGTLTAALLRRGASVVALEKDPAMRGLLAHDMADVVAEGRLRIVDGDAGELSLAEFSRPIAVCGNLPYSISGLVFRRLVEEHARVDRAVVMVQREVADRLSAGPGSKAYGALSVFVGSVYAVEQLLRVGPGSFHPPPRVESAVVRMRPLARERAPANDPKFVAVVRAAFGQRRKTLRNALKELDGGRDALDRVGVDGGRRGETLSVEEFAAVARHLV